MNASITRILYLFTRTPLHIGAGASVGAIDQPIQRERHTGFPIIPGSSLKGVFADEWTEVVDDVEKDPKDPTRTRPVRKARPKPERDWLFGTESGSGDLTAGALQFGEARLLAFPIRSARGSFAWLTSPTLLRRAVRDGVIALANGHLPALSLGEVEEVAIFNPRGPLSIEEPADFMPDQLVNARALASKLKTPGDPVSQFLAEKISARSREELGRWLADDDPSDGLCKALAADLKSIVSGPSIWNSQRFQGRVLRPETVRLVEPGARSATARANRLLLEDCYPSELKRITCCVILEDYALGLYSAAPDNAPGAPSPADDPYVALEHLGVELRRVVRGDLVCEDIGQRLIVVSDGMMTFFGTTACEVVQHVRINDATGTADDKGLFNQENVPSETLFYCLVHASAERAKHRIGSDLNTPQQAIDAVEGMLRENPVLQFGADASTGLGYCSVRFATRPTAS